MIICVYRKLQEISFSLRLWRNRWCITYPETDLQDYVQKITLEKSNYVTAGFSTAELNFHMCCNPMNLPVFYRSETIAVGYNSLLL